MNAISHINTSWLYSFGWHLGEVHGGFTAYRASSYTPKFSADSHILLCFFSPGDKPTLPTRGRRDRPTKRIHWLGPLLHYLLGTSRPWRCIRGITLNTQLGWIEIQALIVSPPRYNYLLSAGLVLNIFFSLWGVWLIPQGPNRIYEQSCTWILVHHYVLQCLRGKNLHAAQTFCVFAVDSWIGL